MIILYDHEECGSESAQGAAGTLTNDTIRRIFNKFTPDTATQSDREEDYILALKKSLFVSADMAHAQHPNYSGKHQSNHTPRMHQGIVLKTNVNQRYATDSVSASIMREIAARKDIPIQDFIINQSGGCGTTIGPCIHHKTGIKTVDIGGPQLAMHSIREMCGTTDTWFYKELFKEFFQSLHEVQNDLLSH